MQTEQQLYELAFSHYGSGRYEDAQQLFLLLCGMNPLLSLNWYGLGAAQFMLHEYQKAQQSLEIARNLDVTHLESNILLAEVYLHRDMPEAAAAIINSLKQEKQLNSLEKKLEWLQFRLKDLEVNNRR